MTDTNLGPLYAVASTIEGIVLDVDGVLTDGKITYTSDGNELKSFHVQDGGSLKLLASHGIALAIITGRQSTIFFQHIELIELKALFVGSDRFRVVRPVTANDLVTLRMAIATVESRQEGFRVAYKFEWQGANEADPISNGIFLVRYWPS